MLTCFCTCFTPWLITCLLSCVSVLVFLAGMRPWCKPNHTRNRPKELSALGSRWCPNHCQLKDLSTAQVACSLRRKLPGARLLRSSSASLLRPSRYRMLQHSASSALGLSGAPLLCRSASVLGLFGYRPLRYSAYHCVIVCWCQCFLCVVAHMCTRLLLYTCLLFLH